jgi:hypothetical protein
LRGLVDNIRAALKLGLQRLLRRRQCRAESRGRVSRRAADAAA